MIEYVSARRKQLAIHHLGRDEKMETTSRVTYDRKLFDIREGDEFQLITRISRDGRANVISNLPNGQIAIFDSGDPATFDLQPGYVVKAYVFRVHSNFCIVRMIEVLGSLAERRSAQTVADYVPRSPAHVDDFLSDYDSPVEKEVRVKSLPVKVKPVKKVQKMRQRNVLYHFLDLMQRGHCSKNELSRVLQDAGATNTAAVQASAAIFRRLLSEGFIRKLSTREEMRFKRVKHSRGSYAFDVEPLVELKKEPVWMLKKDGE